MARLMKSHVRVFCISFIFLFVCYCCERNEHRHTQAFGVPQPKDCTPRCKLILSDWYCCDKYFGESKDLCERNCKVIKSCCKVKK
ncbi:hypothetical protein HanIR_Chr15g0730181 [Helianthus annuus]|nr:hypothetical protein HanIR_Chr15g0730181 [Helianthus annuus]